MKTLLVSSALGLGLLLSAGAWAQAPAGATAACKDGTYYTGTTHKGACRGHKGVKEWLGGDSKAAADTSAAGKTAATAKPSKKSKKPAATESAPAASAPAAAPAGATALCKDGTYFTGTTHKGACRGHKGVKEWLGGAAAAAPAAQSAPAKAAPAAAPAAKASPAKRVAPTPASQIEQKAGGGPGLVWVNSGSKVYHCQGDEWYGKTKEGSYMSEAAAKAAGNRAARGKECGQ